jgi:phage FluMu protein gp41
MTEDLIEITDRLNQVLAEENALLDALDLPAATGLLLRKRDAVAALQGSLATAAAADLSPEDAERLRDSMQRLTELGEANRTAIERGLALQMRLIQTIAQAVPRARAQEAPVYQPNGSQLPPRPPEAYAFLSRM